MRRATWRVQHREGGADDEDRDRKPGRWLYTRPLAPSRRMALVVTSTVAPVSARMAGQSPVTPRMVVTRNTALRPSAMVMF
jgi:hypothetical protein